MRQSQLLSKTQKTTPKEAQASSHALLLKADFISQLSSGIYNLLPLGFLVHRNIETIIREELDKIGCQEVLLPALQPREIWEKTGRWNHMDPPLFKIKDRHQKEFALGSTHEEVIAFIAKPRIQSYRDLPLALYQIQTKFRNEVRFSGGLLRAREFVMKDLYSFHSDEADLERFFKKVLIAYDAIFQRLSLHAIKSEASGGVFTKEKTYEFQLLSPIGEDRIVFCKSCEWAANSEVFQMKREQKCPKCKKGNLEIVSSIELGHTFRLGTRYADVFDLFFLDRKGRKCKVLMGCYGIGVGRLMASIVEVHHDKKGIIWPENIAPFRVHLLSFERNKKVQRMAEQIYKNLQKNNIEVLYDDRLEKSVGEKFADADLIGVPFRVVVSEKTLERRSVEVKERKRAESKLIPFSKLSQAVH